jgi:hypothetical protein
VEPFETFGAELAFAGNVVPIALLHSLVLPHGIHMHAISLAEMASTFVGLATTMLDRRVAPSRQAAQDYWVHHRSRHDLWSQRLAEHRDAISQSGASYRARLWCEIAPVMQEVLVSEPLSRTLACFAAHLEERAICDELAPLAQSVLVSHVEARYRCLHLIVFGPGLPVETAVKLNRVRRQAEVYSDKLLASFPPAVNAEGYCFDEDLVARTRESLQSSGVSSGFRSEASSGTWLNLHLHLLAHQLWRSLQLDLDWRTGNGAYNHRISQAVLALLPAEVFDSLGIPKLQHRRKARTSDSPESDGKKLDQANGTSPLNLLFKHLPHERTVHQPKGRRWL